MSRARFAVVFALVLVWLEPRVVVVVPLVVAAVGAARAEVRGWLAARVRPVHVLLDGRRLTVRRATAVEQGGDEITLTPLPGGSLDVAGRAVAPGRSVVVSGVRLEVLP